jgi:hypothetical protein
MNNYHLTGIKEINGCVFLETPYYWGPGLPVFASKKDIIKEIENSINGNATDLVKSGLIELNWINDNINTIVLEKLLSNDERALFLPKQYRTQVLNAKNRQQPFCFFIEKGIKLNFGGNQEMRLRQSCEAKPHNKGYKYGYNLSIVLGTSVHEIELDKSLTILNTTIYKDKLIQNKIFN